MTPRGPLLYDVGLLRGYRTAPVRGLPAEVWELSAFADHEVMVERFVEAARVQHEHPCGLFATIERFDERELVAIAPPWIQLQALIRSAGGLPAELVTTYVRDVARWLSSESTFGRSLTPSTLAITIGGQPRLLDVMRPTFGGSPIRPVQGLAYLSPELVRGHETSERSNIYSLGLVASEMLTGARVHQGTDMEILLAIRDGARPDAPALARHPDPVRGLLDRMLTVEARVDPRQLVAMIEGNLPRLLWSPEQMFETVRRIAPAEAEAAIVYGY